MTEWESYKAGWALIWIMALHLFMGWATSMMAVGLFIVLPAEWLFDYNVTEQHWEILIWALCLLTGPFFVGQLVQSPQFRELADRGRTEYGWHAES